MAQPRDGRDPDRQGRPRAGSERPAGSRRPRPSAGGVPAGSRTGAASGTRRVTRGQGGKGSGARRAPGGHRGGRPRGGALATARMRLAPSGRRLRWMLLSILMVVTLFMGRAMQLQAFDSRNYATEAARQMTHTMVLQPQRGTITDRYGNVMASTVPAVNVIADPWSISRNGQADNVTMTDAQKQIGAKAPKAIADILVKHLGGDEASWIKQLTATDKSGKLLHYKVIAKQVESSTWNDISNDLNAGGTVDGVKAPYWFGLVKEDNPERTYPDGSVGGNVVGLFQSTVDSQTGTTGKARAGVELALDSQLSGTPGKETYESSVYGRIPLGTDVLVPATDGTNYTLTLDATLQQEAETALAKGIENAGASTGEAVVMNIKTGEVLADASLPGYNPAHITNISAPNLGNRSVQSQYEPGSVEKVLTMAALADKGLVTPETKLVVPSRIKSGDGYITDDFSHGNLRLNARGVVANSSNIGTVMLARKLDKASLVNYLKSFGLGSTTGIELPNETPGVLPSASMPNYTRDQIAFGQGLTVNAVQMAAAVAGIVNDGVYNPPTLIKSASTSDGKSVAIPAKQSRRVISKQASAEVRDMMQAVIQLNPSSRRISGYNTIGKSGTAQRAANGSYDGFTSSFALAGPTEDPQLLVYVVLDQPETDAHQGSQVALPVANAIMSQALPRYGVKPSSTVQATEATTWKP